ncbi:ABC transporter permease [Vicingus serpentipes]|uniref:ABC transporter permease n=1 Tax=Vicingus serpentipes TaxID=1926625 RepID=A0A5C6RYM6_9FLAO|nr:ABC transporter permease [Vicingus serpentipes]TXB67371.1 ABC transporter permease [Vicingus serpentipes]
MSKEKKEIYSKSLSYHAWQRLKKNKLALFGISIICLATLVAVIGPIIRPDSTPKANDQILEITTKKPGFTVDILHVRKNGESEKTSLWSKFSNGVETGYKSLPIYDYSFEGSNIVVEKYTGGDVNNGQILKFNLADVVYPLDHNEVAQSSQNLEFYSVEDGKLSISIDDLKKEIISNNIEAKKFYLGTDKYGRDMLSRLMAGTWISLSVGFISVFISLFIGISLGALAGYFRGWVDDVIMWVINVVWSIPTLLLVIAITLALGKDFWQVFVAVGLTMWVEVARVVRGQVLSIREKEFVEAGRALGFTNGRIIFRHIIPNVLGPVIVISAINFAAAILIEAGLSYLGIGAQPPQATWGKMISEHKGYIITGDAYLAVLPGIAIIIMVLAFVLVGNALRDALDSKSVDDLPAV